MKKKVLSLLLIASLLGCSSCGKDAEVIESETSASVDASVISTEVLTVETAMPDVPTPVPESMQPDIVQIRNICQLATLRVYFHNVAKAIKPRSSGISGIGESDREFWFEYSGYAEIGIDMSRVTMTVDGNEVVVTLPPVEMIGDVHIDSSSYDYESVVMADENWYNVINPNIITAEDLTGAISDANSQMRASILGNNTLMMNAEQRAEELIENYIQQIGKRTDQNITVRFEHYSEA